MTTAIRVLHLEDDPADAQRIGAGLQTADLACDITWVQTREDFIAALQRQAFELVLCDYEVGGMALLRQVLSMYSQPESSTTRGRPPPSTARAVSWKASQCIQLALPRSAR